LTEKRPPGVIALAAVLFIRVAAKNKEFRYMHPLHGTTRAAIQAPIEYRCDSPSFDRLFAGSIGNPFVEPIVLPPLLMAQLALIEVAEADGEIAGIDFDLRMLEVERRIGRPAWLKYNELDGVPAAQARRMFSDWVSSVLDEPVGEGVLTALNSAADEGVSDVRQYGLAALDDECGKLVSMVAGSGRNEALNTAAFRLGQLVKSGALTPDEIERRLYEAAVKNGYVAKDGRDAALKTIKSGLQGGMAVPRIFPGAKGKAKAKRKPTERPDWDHPEAIFDYHDAEGLLIFQNVRYRLLDENGMYVMSNKNKYAKTFRQRRPNGRGGWVNHLEFREGDPNPGIRPIPYRLSDVLDDMVADRTAIQMLFVEGEGKVDRLRALGFSATSIPRGCDGFGPYFADVPCYILPDNDKPGEKRAQFVADGLKGHAKSIWRIDLPDLPPRGDIIDWIDAQIAAGKTETEVRKEIDELNANPWVDIKPGTGDQDDVDEEDKSGDVPFSEIAMAVVFAERHEDKLRYIAKFSRWMRWRDTRWAADGTLVTFDMSREVVREFAAQFEGTAKDRRKLSSASTVAAVERLARADRKMAATIEQWDADPYLLGTPGGTVDLRTGELRPALRSDYITKSTTVAPAAGGCPLFLEFLHRIMGAREAYEMMKIDPERGEKMMDEVVALVSFIQRMLGYALTGDTKEHALFFMYGTGANGKSVLLSTVSGILGDYQTTAPIETFTESHGERHPTELAGLHGARLVTSIETEKNRRWAEKKITNLTGGDKIAARFMRQDFFEFIPIFKLIVAGNHKPTLKTVNEAIRRRINFLPFTVTIPEAERDKDLTEKLKAEWPSILAWMIEGCLMWQRDGLGQPQAVRDATAGYLSDQDMLEQWIEECCDSEPGNRDKFDTVTSLYQSWSGYARGQNCEPGGKISFGDELEGKEYQRDKTKAHGRIIRGIRLKHRNTSHERDD
jgi:putative DNA primase/helicase